MSNLTRDEILAMGAGPGMDAIVHRRVLRRPLLEWHGREGWVSTPTARSVPAYSADIAAAWEILPQFTGERRKDFFFLLTDAIRCRLGSSFYPRFSEILFLLLPEDICRAALLTIVEGAHERG